MVETNVKRKILSLLFFSPFLMPFLCAFPADPLQKLQDVGVLLEHRGCQGPHGCSPPGRRANPPVLFKSCGAADPLPAFTGWRNFKVWHQFKHLFKSFEQKFNMFLNLCCNDSRCPYNKRQITKF